jgi:hypothetical protein
MSGSLATYGLACREAFAEFGIAAPGILARTFAGRIRYGLGPEFVFFHNLHERPMSCWPGYRALDDRIKAAFRIVNFQNGGDWLFRDKVRATDRAIDRSVPVAPVIAVAGRSDEPPRHVPALDDAAAIAALLASDALPEEIFVKPVGDFGGASAFAARRNGENWAVGSTDLSPAEVAARILAGVRGSKGSVIQPRLQSHPAYQPIGGDFGLMTLRVHTALTGDGPQIVSITQKILGGKAIVDNFSQGAKGNLLAGVDMETGLLGTAIGRPAANRIVMRRYRHHPKTDGAIEGFAIPCFAELRAVALRICAAFPETPLLGSDIAITPAGPLLLEINTTPDIALPQLASGQSIAELLAPVLGTLAIDPASRDAARRLLLDRRAPLPPTA